MAQSKNGQSLNIFPSRSYQSSFSYFLEFSKNSRIEIPQCCEVTFISAWKLTILSGLSLSFKTFQMAKMCSSHFDKKFQIQNLEGFDS
jgi:hypothetical protein